MKSCHNKSKRDIEDILVAWHDVELAIGMVEDSQSWQISSAIEHLWDTKKAMNQAVDNYKQNLSLS